MSVFLLILKILGITLLSLIGLILLILLLVLFVPIRYRISGKYEENIEAFARFSWLLHILSFRLIYDTNGLSYKIRIFGIPLKIGEKKEKKPRKEKKPKKEKSLSRTPNEDEITLEGFEQEQAEITEAVTDEKPETVEKADETGTGEEKKQGFFSKLKEYFGKIADLLLNFKEKANAFYQKIVSFKENAVYYLDLITNEKNRETFGFVLQQVFKILRAIRPRKWHVYAKVGFEEPDTTGKVLVAASLLYPFAGSHLKLDPLFDEKALAGNADLKGRVFLIVLLIAGWKLYFNKDLKKLIKDLKKEA
ncbi:MAG: hypothetical protein K6D90_06280 [Lachnospiraceae bacterium]|nr:hypothetical protein [Lachnospiraceae bacterium]